MKKGLLQIVSVPIGNYEDITIRALNALNSCDWIVCEELKPAKRLLSYHKISKELISLNEHNELAETENIIDLLLQGKKLCLISDQGTPLFSDPGGFLFKKVIENNIQVDHLPGANSVIAALVLSGLNLNRFFFFGWLSREKEKRKAELVKLSKIHEIIVLMETPYRLKKIISEIKHYFTSNQYIVLAYKLTMPEQVILRGKIEEIEKIIDQDKLKGEFVLIIDNSA